MRCLLCQLCVAVPGKLRVVSVGTLWPCLAMATLIHHQMCARMASLNLFGYDWLRYCRNDVKVAVSCCMMLQRAHVDILSHCCSNGMFPKFDCWWNHFCYGYHGDWATGLLIVFWKLGDVERALFVDAVDVGDDGVGCSACIRVHFIGPH